MKLSAGPALIQKPPLRVVQPGRLGTLSNFGEITIYSMIVVLIGRIDGGICLLLIIVVTAV